MMHDNLVIWHSSNSSLGSWVIRTPTLVTIIPKSQDLIWHTWTWGVFNYWHLSTETANGLLSFPTRWYNMGHVATALCIMSTLTWAEISVWILTPLIQLFYLLFFGSHIGLDHSPYLHQIGPRSEEILFVGMCGLILFWIDNLAAVPCSCSWISSANLLFHQTWLSLVCPVSLQ